MLGAYESCVFELSTRTSENSQMVILESRCSTRRRFEASLWGAELSGGWTRASAWYLPFSGILFERRLHEPLAEAEDVSWEQTSTNKNLDYHDDSDDLIACLPFDQVMQRLEKQRSAFVGQAALPGALLARVWK